MDNARLLTVQTPEGRTVSLTMEQNGTLLDAIRAAGLYLDAPCGGNGTCGKCGVSIIDERGGKRTVLACQTAVNDHMRVVLPHRADVQVLTGGAGMSAQEATHQSEAYALAFDVGTTTIAGYLVRMRTGNVIHSLGTMNPQSAFGADVISRLQYASEHGSGELTLAVRSALSDLSHALMDACGVSSDQVRAVCVLGNTCMHHLFLSLPTGSLAVSPYVPAQTAPLCLSAIDYGLPVSERAVLYVPGVIAGFVGSDTSGCLLSEGFDKTDDMRLLVDIGTNGEIVLGNAVRRIACSTAAGPALEGARIRFGMRAQAGAIDHVTYDHDTLSVSVIGGDAALGICGSGLIDAIACMLDIGVLLPDGRLLKGDEAAAKGLHFSDRLIEIDGKPAFRLGGNVSITQSDVREVQLSKAAIRTGIDSLLTAMDVTAADVSKTLLAGAFGSFLRPESALRIGLLPEGLYDRICAVGNAAGAGAVMMSASTEAFDRANRMAERTEHLELASTSAFQDAFIDALSFPGKEAEV